MTSSLFATTVIASFFVVALPHVLPCPAPRAVYADGEMPDGTTTARRRRRRRTETIETADGVVQFAASSSSTTDGGDSESATRTTPANRECPIPKPKGILGELLGFKKGSTSDDSGSQSRPDR